MSTIIVFGTIVLTGVVFGVLANWLAGRGGAVIVGLILAVLCLAGMAWSWYDAQGKTGFDAIAAGIGMIIMPLALGGFWIGVLAARIVQNRRMK